MATSTKTEDRDAQIERGASTKKEAAGCCGGAAPEGADACCALDAEVKSAGGSGCGCGTKTTAPATTNTGCC